MHKEELVDYTLQPIQTLIRFVPFYAQAKRDYLPDLKTRAAALKIDLKHFFAKELMNLKSPQATLNPSQYNEKLRVHFKALKARRILRLPSEPFSVPHSTGPSDTLVDFAQDLIFTQLTPGQLSLSHIYNSGSNPSSSTCEAFFPARYHDWDSRHSPLDTINGRLCSNAQVSYLVLKGVLVLIWLFDSQEVGHTSSSVLGKWSGACDIDRSKWLFDLSCWVSGRNRSVEAQPFDRL